MPSENRHALDLGAKPRLRVDREDRAAELTRAGGRLVAGCKLSPEERAAHRREALAKAREAKKTKKAQMEALMEKLAQSGKSIEELMAELGQ